MHRETIPRVINGSLLVLLGSAQGLLWLSPAVLPQPKVGAALLVAVLLTLPTWSLIHEAFHGSLDANPARNTLYGRVLAVLLAAPFAMLRHGHLLHHRYSRIDELSETYDPARTPRWRAWIGHYLTILGGLYAGELLSSLLVWLPAAPRSRVLLHFAGDNPVGQGMARAMTSPVQLRQARQDSLAILGLVLVAGYLHAAHPLLLLAALAARGCLLSFFDNSYHYGSATGNPRLARNHRLPRWAGACLLNFNYHGMHHRQPGLPWIHLPAAAQRSGAGWDGSFLRQALRQLRGPIARDDLPRAQALARDAEAEAEAA